MITIDLTSSPLAIDLRDNRFTTSLDFSVLFSAKKAVTVQELNPDTGELETFNLDPAIFYTPLGDYNSDYDYSQQGGDILFLWDEDTDLFINVHIEGSLDFPNIDDFVDPFYSDGDAFDADVNAYTDELLNWRSNLGQLSSRKMVIEDVVTITSDQPVSLSQIGSISDLFEGDTVINGTQFNDILRGDADGQSGNDTINGGDGGDTIFGDPGIDVINGGGSDIDVLSYGLSTSGIGLQLGILAGSFGDAAGDQISAVELIVGSKHNDQIDIPSSVWLLAGNGGADTIYGSSGNNVIFGDFAISQGALIGELSDANLQQLLANAELGGAEGGDTIAGGLGFDQIFGGGGNDKLYAGEFDFLFSSNDTSGNELYGQSGEDHLFAWTFSENTTDELDGGADRDTYYADGQDKIIEFELGETAHYRTGSQAERTMFISDVFGSRAIFFDGTDEVIGELAFDNTILANEVRIYDSEFFGHKVVSLDRTADELPFLTKKQADEINWKYNAQQISAVAKLAFNLVAETGAFKRYSDVVGKKAAEYLAKAGASKETQALGSEYASEVSRDLVAEVLGEAAEDAVTGENRSIWDYISVFDIAKILLTNTLAKPAQIAFSFGEYFISVITNEIGRQFELFMNTYFVFSEGEFIRNKDTGEFEARSGTVTDGNISGAIVFGDENGNGVLDDGEAFTVSDGGGNYILSNPIGPVVASGGIDVLTGLPFAGRLIAAEGGTTVTPLSTLAHYLFAVPVANPNEALSQALGLSETYGFGATDPIEQMFEGADDSELVAKSNSALMNTVQLIASAFAGQRDPDENADEAYSALAQTLQTVAVIDLTSSGFIKSILDTFVNSPAITASNAFLTTLSEIIAAANQQTFDVTAGSNVDAFFEALGTVGRAVQGSVADALEAAAGNDAALLAAKDATTGQSLADLIADAGDELLGAPTDILLDSFFANEGLAGGSIVASVTVLDPDLLDTHTLSIVSASLGNPFELDGNNLILGPDGALDADIQDSFDITLRAEDGDGNTLDKTVTLFVGDTGLDLVFGGALAENSAAGTAAAVFGTNGSLLGATPVYSLIDDANGLFELLGNTLVVADGASLDYETQQSHTVTVRAQEGSAPPEERNFVIQIQDRPISDIAISSGGIVRETDTAGALVATFEASENPVEPTAVFTLIEDGAGSFVLNGNRLEVAPGATFDYNTQSNHIVTIGASDPGGPVFEESFDILVQNVGPIVGTPDPDALNGTAFDDDIQALASDDTINGSGGSDLIDGGPGHDVVVYDGERADYSQTLNGNGTITVEKPGGGTDTLTTIERIDFTDGDYVYDLTSPNTGFGYRIYQASFGRTPDEGGVRFWIGNLDNFDQQGWSDYEKEQFLASQFIQSDEFRGLYGTNPSNFDYIDAMYQNVLFRLPDQAGYDFWVGGMVNDGLTREDILIAFTKSDENVNNNAVNLDDGVWVV